MKVHVLLADKGTQNPQAGTLNLLNVGWGGTGVNPQGMTPPAAVAMFFEAEFLECNQPVSVVLELLDEDGHVVNVPGPTGPQPMRVQQSVSIATPVGAPAGAPGKANILTEVHPGLPLSAGSYKWVVTIDGRTSDDWTVTFFVVSPPQPPVFGNPQP